MVIINGEQVQAAGRTLADYMAEKGYRKTGIAVAINDKIIPMGKHGETVLKDGDRVEIVECVAGG